MRHQELVQPAAAKRDKTTGVNPLYTSCQTAAKYGTPQHKSDLKGTMEASKPETVDSHSGFFFSFSLKKKIKKPLRPSDRLTRLRERERKKDSSRRETYWSSASAWQQRLVASRLSFTPRVGSTYSGASERGGKGLHLRRNSRSLWLSGLQNQSFGSRWQKRKDCWAHFLLPQKPT